MSFKRKNARRLRELRKIGVPIDGNYRITAKWRDYEVGDYIDEKKQKELIAMLRMPAVVKPPAKFPARLRAGRTA